MKVMGSGLEISFSDAVLERVSGAKNSKL